MTESGAGSRLRFVAKYAGAIAFLALIVYLVGGIRLPADVRLPWLVAGGAVFFTIPLLDAVAWGTYLRVTEDDAPLVPLFRATLAAGFTAQFLPSPAPSMTRPVYLKGEVGMVSALAATLVDRINLLLVYGFVLAGTGVVFVVLTPELAWIGLLSLPLLVVHLLLRRSLIRREVADLQDTLLGRLAAAVGGLGSEAADTLDASFDEAGRMLASRRAYAGGLGIQALAVVGGRGGMAAAIAIGLGLTASLGIAVLVTVASLALALIPVLPQGLGAVEGFGTYVLGQAGIDPSLALTFLLVRRGLVYALSLTVGGVAFFAAGVDVLDRIRAEAVSQGDDEP